MVQLTLAFPHCRGFRIPLASAQDRDPRRQQPPHTVPLAATGRRRQLLSVAAPLLFLPWRGCDVGGNYATGVADNNCQQVYQPAAAAEKRFAAKQRAAADAAAAAAAAPLAAETAREERSTVLKEQAAFERTSMEAERARQTQQLVENMWQSLE